MKVLKPDNLALLYRSMRFAQRNSLALGMMACFDLASRPSSSPQTLDGLLPESELWKVAAQALGDALLDEGNPKPAGEYKVYGAACAPRGAEVEQQRVNVRIGTLAKSLVVSGERHFNLLGAPSAPRPFARMPIDPSTAFGGPGCEDNPLGKGYAALERDGQQVWPLPNVESEAKRIVSRGERATPAGFWGFDAMAPQRRQHLGTCNERWLKRDWPYLPDDTSPDFFMSAPPDQRLKGFFTGNEVFEIANMHPQHSTVQGRLPGLRARCFVNTRQAGSSVRLREVETKAETVWLFPELERGIVLYRALAEVTDADATDVLHVMTAWELLGDPPLPFEHYEAEFLRSLPAAADAAPTASVPPAAPAAAASVAAVPAVAVPASAAMAAPAAEAELPEGFAASHAMAGDLDRQTQALMAKHGLTEKDLARFLDQEPEPRVPSFAEIEKMAEDLETQTRTLMRKHDLTDKDIDRFLKPSQPNPEPDVGQLQSLLREVDQQTQDKLRKAGLTQADAFAQLGSRPELAETVQSLQALGPDPGLSSDVVAALAQMALPVIPAPAAPALPGGAALPALPEAAVAPQLTREDVIARHAAGKNFSGYDLSGLDLSKLDLTGADFSDALLERASFAQSKLQDAKFVQALLQETDFSAANLQRAQMTQSSASAGKFANADLGGARLEDADFTGADFSAARLERAELGGAVFDRATMSGLKASACRAERAQFTACDLSGADFSAAALGQASFVGSRVPGGNFSKAVCEQADFQGTQAQQAIFTDANLSASRADAQACFDGAQFARAQLGRAAWDGAQMRGALLDGAMLENADFSNVQAEAAQFRLASAKGAKFSKADLRGADLSSINLFKGSLRKAKLDGTLLREANLYGVDFEGTQPTIASLEGSNVDRTILLFRPPVI